MAVSIHVPRINNNDDEVKLVELQVVAGDKVTQGQVLGSVETDKAVVDIESPADGFVLAIRGEAGDTVTVGAVLIWLGASAEEQAPEEGPVRSAEGPQTAPTAKAQLLLREYGLLAAQVTASGERLSADDVRRHIDASGLAPAASGTAGHATPTPRRAGNQRPDQPGQARTLASHERGMLHTVSWQRDMAVPGYLEMACDDAAWQAHAQAYGQQHKLLLNPALPLMAWRLVALCAEMPRFNATLVDEQRHEFDDVNLGFTVQAGEVLYLAVMRAAQTLGEAGFVQGLVGLQRRAAAHELAPQELSGATVGFSSMARWKVARHVPVLAPHTALMVAHTVDADGRGVLGATYDHRVLHGGDVAMLLRKLGASPKAAV